MTGVQGTADQELWYCREYHRVGDLMFSQEDASQTHQSVLKISRNTAIRQSSIGSIIHDLFTATHLRKGK